MKTKVFFRVYKDDDYAEKGWAYEVSRDQDYTDILECGHTYDHDRDGSIEYIKEIAEDAHELLFRIDEIGKKRK